MLHCVWILITASFQPEYFLNRGVNFLTVLSVGLRRSRLQQQRPRMEGRSSASHGR